MLIRILFAGRRDPFSRRSPLARIVSLTKDHGRPDFACELSQVDMQLFPSVRFSPREIRTSSCEMLRFGVTWEISIIVNVFDRIENYSDKRFRDDCEDLFKK